MALIQHNTILSHLWEETDMKIIVVGAGKVGTALVQQLSVEGHSVTLIDINADKVQRLTEELDIMGITGNGTSFTTLSEAGMEQADVFIAVTGSDELNLLCCMFAKKVGKCHAIARVRNPVYSHELDFIKQQLGLSTIINPELAAATEISRLLRFPAATSIDTFADGRVRLIKFELKESCGISGLPLKKLGAHLGCEVLVTAVERGQEVIIPSGEFVLQTGDMLTILATQEKARQFFKKINLPVHPVRSCMIVGGGTIGYYLAKDLLEHDIPVRIVERDPRRCEVLAEELPGAKVLQGDAIDRSFLQSAGLPLAESFVALTNLDEENVLLAMYAKKHSNAKLITKVNRLEFDDILDGMDLGSIIYPKYMTCDTIVQYVRAKQNEAGSNVKTLYRILDDRVEALEFTIHEKSMATGIPLMQLKLRPNLLVCCIMRDDDIIIPRGSDCLQVGDNVVVVTLERGLHDVRDILAH